ncbi:MAG: S41 family peptidase [Cyanobacteria bacterium J06576_12]
MASPNAADSTDEPVSTVYDLPLTPATRTAVLGAIGQKLEAEYAFPEVAKKIQADIQNRLATEGYQDVKSGAQLATTLTAQLQTLSSDLHLKVHFSPAVLPHLEPQTEIPPDELALQQQQGALRNFDFNRVERLRGNVGYLELFSFEPPEFAGAVAAASMQFLANTSALIIDLRHNRGGSASMVALLTSYLFPPYPAIHLTNLQWPKKESSQTTGPSGTQQSWTLPYVEGPRYLNKPVYILIGPETFSAAEEFAYNLKHLKRVVLVGETTAGGANPGTGFRLHDHFWMFIPTGQAISIVTGGNWEGSGVLPDFKVPAELSVKTAQLLAFRKLLRDDSEGDSPGQLPSSLKRELEESLTITEDDLNRMQQDLVSNMSKIR